MTTRADVIRTSPAVLQVNHDKLAEQLSQLSRAQFLTLLIRQIFIDCRNAPAAPGRFKPLDAEVKFVVNILRIITHEVFPTIALSLSSVSRLIPRYLPLCKSLSARIGDKEVIEVATVLGPALLEKPPFQMGSGELDGTLDRTLRTLCLFGYLIHVTSLQAQLHNSAVLG